MSSKHGPIAEQKNMVLANVQELVIALSANKAEGSDSELTQAINSLNEICAFLDSLGLTNTISPLRKLLRDANDIRNGAKATFILKQRTQEGRPNATTNDAMRGFLAALIDFLMDHGSPNKQAIEFIVHELSGSGIQMKITAKKLKDIRNRIDNRSGDTAARTRLETRKLLDGDPEAATDPGKIVRQTIHNIPPWLMK